MTQRVFKYEVPIDDRFTLKLPRHAKIIAFQVQHEQPQVWALVDPEEKTMMDRDFILAGTGHPIDEREDNLHHLGTWQMRGGSLVWHLFEVIRF